MNDFMIFFFLIVCVILGIGFFQWWIVSTKPKSYGLVIPILSFFLSLRITLTALFDSFSLFVILLLLFSIPTMFYFMLYFLGGTIKKRAQNRKWRYEGVMTYWQENRFDDYWRKNRSAPPDFIGHYQTAKMREFAEQRSMKTPFSPMPPYGAPSFPQNPHPSAPFYTAPNPPQNPYNPLPYNPPSQPSWRQNPPPKW